MQSDRIESWTGDQPKRRDGDTAIGLNNNVEFAGKQLHVQTETIGSPASRIVTQIFSNGRVVFSRKSACPDDPDEIRRRMHEQHSRIIRDLMEKEAKILASRVHSK